MRSSTGIYRVLGLLVGGLLFAFSAVVLSETLSVAPGSKAAGLDSCVAPTAEMRRYHMQYLTHDRNETVRAGKRGVKYSLSACVDCHAAKDDKGGYTPVNAEGQFCEACHNYAAVEPVCFQCHRKVPEEKSSALGAVKAGNDGYALGLLMQDGQVPSLSADEYARVHAIVEGED